MDDEQIASLLVGEMKTVNLRFPKGLLDAMTAAMKKKDPTRKDYGLINHAINYFAALGLLAWEEGRNKTAGAESTGGKVGRLIPGPPPVIKRTRAVKPVRRE